MSKQRISFSCILLTVFFLPSALYAKSHSGLLPQKAYLSKTNNHKLRELYITVLNTNSRIFRNNENPITVLVNGVSLPGNIFAKKYNERYYLWADIRPNEEGAIFVSFPDNTFYRKWKQCQELKITIDPEKKLAKDSRKTFLNQKSVHDTPQTRKPEVETYTLLLHDKDYASDCRYVEKE